MFNWLQKTDILGNHLTFEKEFSTTFKSLLGGFLSILLIVSSLILTLMFGNEVYERKAPVVFSLEEKIEESRLYLKDMPMLFSFNLQTGAPLKDPDKYFAFKVKRFSFSATLDITYEESLTLKLCDYKDFDMHQSFIKKFTDNVFTQFFCLTHNQDSYVFNSFANPFSAFYKIEFYKCDQSVTNCPPDLESIMQEVYILTTFMNTYVDSSNFTDPIQYYEYTYAQQLSDSFMKRLYLSFTYDVYDSDNGWLLTDVKEYGFVSLSQSHLDINPIDGIDYKNMMYVVSFDSPNIRRVIKRSYLKLQELIAKVGGLVKGLTIALQLMFSHYLRYNYIYFVVNSANSNASKKLNIPFTDIETSTKKELFSIKQNIKNKLNESTIAQNYVINMKDGVRAELSSFAKANETLNFFSYKFYILHHQVCWWRRKGNQYERYLSVLNCFDKTLSFDNYIRTNNKGNL